MAEEMIPFDQKKASEIAREYNDGKLAVEIAESIAEDKKRNSEKKTPKSQKNG